MGDLDGSNVTYQRVRRFYKPFIHQYTALSRDLADYLVDKVHVSPDAITLACNGVDTERFHPSPGGPQLIAGCPFDPAEHCLVGTVGRMQAVKDQPTLARAFGLPVRELVRNIRGDGPWYRIQRSAEIPTLRARKRREATDRPEAPTPNSFHSLAGGYPTRHMHPYLIKVRNMNDETLTPHEHHGEEFLHVLEGQLEVTTYAEEQEVREVLQPGDSVYLDSSVPHFVRGETRNPLSETSALVLDVFWCPLGESYLFEE